MHWIKYPTKLSGETVDLVSLEKTHFAELETLAKDKRIWEFMSFPCDDSTRFHELFNLALIERDNGSQFPFAILHKKSGKIIGSTRFVDISPAHKKLEIGWTWLDPAYWATEVNLECKLLLLTFCFEHLHTVRVMLRTDEKNLRSKKAIQKIGGTFEGIIRHDVIRDNGTNRNSAYFSIINSEWENVKINLQNLYNRKKSASI